VVGLLGNHYLSLFASADQENQRLADELKDLEKLLKKTAEKRKVTDAISDWNANSVVWLDELRDLSAKIPPGQDLVLHRLSMAPSRGGRASISFQGLAREQKVVTRMENSLRDERHEVQTPRVEEHTRDKSFSWNFETSVSVQPEKEDSADRTAKDQKPDEVKISSRTRQERN
jgi:Tfp pilus assembly protein PilN